VKIGGMKLKGKEKKNMWEKFKEIEILEDLSVYERENLDYFFEKGKETFNFEDFEVALQILEDHNKVRVDWEKLIHRLEVEKKW